MILNMRERMLRMNREVAQLFEYLKAKYDLDSDFFHDRFGEALVPAPPTAPAPVSRPGQEEEE